MNGFAVAKKAPIHRKIKKKKKKKKNCKYKISKTVCRNFLKDKWVSRYLTFGDFSVPENCSPQSF